MIKWMLQLLLSNTKFTYFFYLTIICFILSISPSYGQEAVISGDTTICSGGTVDIYLSLSGVSPWDVSIELNGPGGTFTYDFENIYSSDTVLKFNESGNFKIISASDNNGPINFSPGNIVTANLYAPLTEAVLSGGTKFICEEKTYNAQIELRGNAPWNIAYSLNGSDPIEITNILSSTYYLNVFEEGTYTMISVSDMNCPGTAVGSFNLVHYSKSTALLVGGDQICEEGITPLSVVFSGFAPYNIEYTLNAVPEGVIGGIDNPFSFDVSKPGLYEISEFTDDNGCLGTASGSATVTLHPPVDIEFVNLNSTYALNTVPFVLEGDPSGGEFKGDGVISSTSMFYPQLAVDYGVPPYEIIYTYTNPSTGCTYSDTAYVNIIESQAEIIFPGDGKKDVYCSNEDPFIITGANLNEEIGSFSISGGQGLVDNGDNTATIYPAILHDGEFTITYSYQDGGSTEEVKETIDVEYVEPISFVGLDQTEVCSNAARFELEGDEPDGVFSGSAVELDSTLGVYFFNPQIGDIGNNEVVFSFVTESGCEIDTSENIIINDIPKIDFRTQDSCVNENAPKPIQFINLTESIDDIVSWEWNFNDAGSSQNTSTEKDPVHTYESSEDRKVTLSAITNKGCEESDDKDIFFNKTPLSGFVFSSECFNPDTSILFKHSVKSNDEIIDYEWVFSNRNGSEILKGDSVFYTFDFLDEHSVKLIVKTIEGCVDTSEENIQLKPTIKMSEGPYFQDFEIQNTYWENEFNKVLNNNSWVFGSTEESFIGEENNQSWYTNLSYLGEESSWIKSPCFDFSNVDRPFIKFSIWRDFEQTRDGANLQYSLDNGITWNLVGTIDDGLNWYNSYQILGNPGGHDEGWSDENDINWVSVEHRLDELSEQTNAQFRIVYGSDGTNNENGGLAFDSVWFKERNHVVLMEHFTNNADDFSLGKLSLIEDLRNKNYKDMIDIQYHTNFPGIDSLNLENPIEPSSRLLYYGYSDVPLSIIDGDNNNPYDYVNANSTVTNKDLIVKSLSESKFEIELTTTTEDNNLDIEYKITSLYEQEDIDIFLYIVVLEDSLKQVIDNEEMTFMNTFRKFLPDPGGISLPSNWQQDGEYVGSYNWEIEKVKNVENMKVVLFIQDETTKKVLQAEIDKKLQPVNVNNKFVNQLHKVVVYPNPFESSLRITRNGLTGDLKVDIITISGSMLSTIILSGNESDLEISADLPSGLYFMRITELKTGFSDTRRIVKY